VVRSPPKEDDLLLGVLHRQVHRVQRRVDHAHIAARALDLEEIALGAWHPQHIAKGAEDHARLGAIASALSINSSGVTHTGQPGP